MIIMVDIMSHKESSGKKTPLLQRLIYGQVPPGYREKEAAVPLAVGDNVYSNVYGPGYRGKIRVIVGPRPLLRLNPVSEV